MDTALSSERGAACYQKAQPRSACSDNMHPGAFMQNLRCLFPPLFSCPPRVSFVNLNDLLLHRVGQQSGA